MDNNLKVPTNKCVSQIKLSYQSKVKAADRPQISTSAEAYEVLLANWDMDIIELQEQLKIMLLDHGSRVLGIVDINIGGITSSIVDLRLIFASVIQARATRFIMAHNHPSGGVKPSDSDNQTTRKIVQAAKLLDVQFLDHLIVTPDKFYSYAEEGLI